jgi:hypothetical protein
VVKIWDIALFMIIFNMMLSVFVQLDEYNQTSLQPLNTSNEISGFKDWKSYALEAATEPGEEGGVLFTVKMVLRAIPMILLAFLHATVLLPWFLGGALNLAPGSAVVVMFTSLVWLVYAVGALQLWLNRRIEQT